MIINNINNHWVCELTQIADIVDVIIEFVSFDSTRHVAIAETSNNTLGIKEITALLIFSLYLSLY